MDKGWVLRVTAVEPGIRVGTSTMSYEYRGITDPNHTCRDPRRLAVGDVVTVKNLTATSVLVTGCCGCDYLLWDLVS
jgi:hypothetical protein